MRFVPRWCNPVILGVLAVVLALVVADAMSQAQQPAPPRDGLFVSRTHDDSLRVTCWFVAVAHGGAPVALGGLSCWPDKYLERATMHPSGMVEAGGAR